jgi:hypothetical protein
LAEVADIWRVISRRARKGTGPVSGFIRPIEQIWPTDN